MPEPELFKQNCVVAKQVGRLFRVPKRRDWIGLGIVTVLHNYPLWEGLCTHSVPDDKDRVLEFTGSIWREPFDRTGGPSKRGETGVFVRTGSIIGTRLLSNIPIIPSGANLIRSNQQKEQSEAIITIRTRRGDLSGDIYRNIKQVRDCRIGIDVIVSSKDSCPSIGSQIARRGVSGLVNSDIARGYVILVISLNRDIVSSSGLQNESRELIKVTVHSLAPRHRSVQKDVEEFYGGVSSK